MKKRMLVAALGLTVVQTQAQAPADNLLPSLYPPAGRGLEIAAPAQGLALVRKPGRTNNYSWNPTLKSWKYETGRNYTYTPAGLPAQMVEADSVTGQLRSRSTYTYNAANAKTSQVDEIWNGSSWQNQARVLITYNSQNSFTELINQFWVAGAWENYSRAQETYDTYNNPVSSLRQRWDAGAWKLSVETRRTYTYNASGQYTQVVYELLGSNSTAYLPTQRYSYTYVSPTSRYIATGTTENWENGAWVNGDQTSYSYDAQQRVSQYTESGWLGGAWQMGKRYTYTYGTTPNSFQKVYETFEQNAWEKRSRNNKQTTAAGDFLQDDTEIWMNGNWVLASGLRALLSYDIAGDVVRSVEQRYDATMQSYVNQQLFTYGDFQSITLGAKASLLAAQTTLYPNPTMGPVTLKLPLVTAQSVVQAEIINGLGQVVQRLVLPSGRTTLDLSPQPSGLYTVRLHTSAGVVVKKVVRQ